MNWTEIDEGIQTSHHLNKEELLATTVACEEDEQEEAEPEPEPKIPASTVIKYMEGFLNFIEQQPDEEGLNLKQDQAHGLLQWARKCNLKARKQKKITDFFRK